MAGPLDGIRVLDFGQFLAGPLGPMVMADLGADVIKVEPVRGDGMRPIVTGSFMGCQRGKRDIALDLKQPEGLRIALELVATADIVHHNMTLGVADRLGIGYEHCKAVRPDIIYCNTYMYGAIGPLAHLGGVDPLAQAAAGLEWEQGPVAEGNPPLWYRYGHGDAAGRDDVGHRRAHRPVPPEPDGRGSVDLDVDAARHDAVHRRLVARRRRHTVAAPDARPRTARARRAVPALRHPGRLAAARRGARGALARAVPRAPARGARRRHRASPRARAEPSTAPS